MGFTDRFNALPKNVQDVFASNEPRLMLERACFLYRINEDYIEKLALPIRDIFLKDIELGQLPFIVQKNLNVRNDVSYGIAYELNAKIFNQLSDYFTSSPTLLTQWNSLKIPSLIPEDKAWKMVLEIEPWILEEEKEKEAEQKKEDAEFKANTDSLPLSQALEKHPTIGEQLVTSGELKLRTFPDPVRPSIKNWIVDFHDVLGGGKHSPIERGNYLFQSENGKKLNAEDRQKLGLIFKSLDEESPLTIDVKNEKIIFNSQAPNNQPSGISMQQSSPSPSRQTFAQDADVFERYAPKNINAPVGERVNNLEKFYSKYPESSSNNEIKKEQVEEKTQSNFSPNFASGNISFTAHQRLPVEQQSNLYHISPRKTSNSQDEIVEQQRIYNQKNIVNLKEI